MTVSGAPVHFCEGEAPARPICSVEGCDRKHHARGFCGNHYRAAHLYGDPALLRPYGATGCSVEECERPHQARGLCSLHYDRVRVTGSTAAPRRRQGCEVIGCHHEHKARGYCARHYRSLRLYGDPVALRPFRGKVPCSLPGCERVHKAHGLCAPHAAMRRRMLEIPMQLTLPGWVDPAPIRELLDERYGRGSRLATLAKQLGEYRNVLTRIRNGDRVQWHVADRIATKLGYPGLVWLLTEDAA